MKSPSPPPAPDPKETAAAQGAINKETAIAQARLNQVNEITPFGTSTYTPTGTSADGIDQYQREITLNPEEQKILDQQRGITSQLNTLAGDQVGRVSDALSQPFSYDGLPEAPKADDAARQQVIDALYGQYTSRLDPRFEQERNAFETQLANQGIGVGTDAYSRAMSDFGRYKNDAYTSALNQSVASGGSEQSRLFGLQGAARERGIQEQAYLRNLPLNEVAALMGTGSGVTMPQFSAIPQTGIANTDITGPTSLAYQGGLQNAALQQQSQSSTLGGLFGLGSSGIGALGTYAAFSDRRVKADIKKVGNLDNGLPVYLFRYKSGGPMQIGLMAQDVEKVKPEAVTEVNGIKAVYYDQAVA